MITTADSYLYRDIINILTRGYLDENPRPKYQDGTSAHTISVNQVVRNYNLNDGDFPICTLRPIAWKSAIKEILWIYQKQTSSLQVLEDDFDIHWWNEWESKDVPGTIGQRYGATVHRYNLINKLIDSIQSDPFGRRKIMSLWQESDLEETDGLAPCAFLTMWNVRKGKDKNYLDMTLVQRSGDMLTASGAGGVNEVQYAALLMMIARHCNLTPGIFCHFVQNEQIYDRHIEVANELKNRANKALFQKVSDINEKIDKPMLQLNDEVTDFYSMSIDDFIMMNYEPMRPQLKLELGI